MYDSAKFVTMVVLILFLTWFAPAEEGMWLPHQIKDLNLSDDGLKISPERIYDPNSPGLMNAVVSISRHGTGSFVSKNGLILTNHHMAFGAVQQASDKEHDYIANGFLASTPAEEIPALGYFIDVFLGYEDVTTEVLKHLKPYMNPEQRFKAIEGIEKKLAAKAEKKGKDLYCTVNSMYSGNRYYLFRYKRLQDVRIVYAPPESIGGYGGDVDNWMWPRHTGDFSFLRAYVSRDNVGVAYHPDNVPYQSVTFLKVSLNGCKPGDFSFVMGYPGHTNRGYTLSEFQFELQQMKQRIDDYEIITQYFEQAGKKDRAIQIKYASKILSLKNSTKFRQAILDGSQQQSITERKREFERNFWKWVEQDPQRKKKYGSVLSEMENFLRDNKDFYQKYNQFSYLTSRYLGPALLVQAHLIYRTVMEKQKPDIKRERNFLEKDLPDIKNKLKNAERSYHLETDKAFFKFLLNQMLTVDKSLVPDVFHPVLKEGEAGIEKYVDQLYSTEILTNPEKRLELINLKPAALLGLQDPLINLAAELEKELSGLRNKREGVDQQRQDLRKIYLAGLLEMYQGKIAPDANSTIRFTSGPIEGYKPRDGVIYLPQTTLKGVMEKDTGISPFQVPEKLKLLYQTRNYGRYMDKQLNDIPVCFLNVTDSTGGSSGSPVLDANGEIVGLLFDGVYESVVGDLFAVLDYLRVINVDIRYVLFITDKFSGAHQLLNEMGL